MYLSANGKSVRGWMAWLGLLVALNLAAVVVWHYDDGLQESFENHDTRIILRRLQQPHSVWEWFVGDWVLGNGFYRPLPSLLYQLDYWLWGENLLAWKWSNGVLAVANALLVVAFGYALTRQRALAVIAGLIFTVWQAGFLPPLPSWAGWIVLLMGVMWGWYIRDWRRGAIAGCIGFALLTEFYFIPSLMDLHQQSFAYRAVGWIPGRTATLMTLFALLALIGTCWFTRTGKARWGALGLIGFVGALLSYEQAIALPLLMGLCALGVAWQTRRGITDADTDALGGDVRPTARAMLWRGLALAGACLLLLAPYGWFYRARIPSNTEYHQQRLKRFKTISATALNWLVPTAPQATVHWDLVRTAPFTLAFPGFWVAQLGMVAYLLALREGLRRRWGWLGWLGSLIAYAPLMPVLPLMHYYYLPAVFRALWAGILLLCLLTPRPTRKVILVAMGDASCPKRSFLRLRS